MQALRSDFDRRPRYPKKVRDARSSPRRVAAKQLAIYASPAGRTPEQAIEPARQEQPALTDAQVVQLAQLGQADPSALRLPPRRLRLREGATRGQPDSPRTAEIRKRLSDPERFRFPGQTRTAENTAAHS